MPDTLELAYNYRHLMGRCDAGAGLSIDEIEAVSAIEARFAAGDIDAGDVRAAGDIDEARPAAPALTASLRGGPKKLVDKVQLVSIQLDSIVIGGAPYVDAGTTFELVVDDEAHRLSYRFKGIVSWTREEESDSLAVCLRLVGVPVLVRRGPRSARAVEGAAAHRRVAAVAA